MSDVPEALKELLEYIAIEQRCSDSSVSVSPILSGGANYTSQLYTAKITSSKKPDLHLFAKSSALSENFQESGLRQLFKIEFIFYTEVARIYETIEDKHNVRGQDRLVFPKFFGGSLKHLQETTVLEDLVTSGFSNCQRLKPIDWKFGSRAVEEMAKLHSLSFAYAKEYPEQYQKMLDVLTILLPNDVEFTRALFGPMYSLALGVVREENRVRFTKFFEQGGAEMYAKFSAPFVCPVLVHSDFKLSNLMERVDQDGKLDIAIIDYQTMKPGSVASDLIYFIFTSTDRQFRGRHMSALVDHYYASLCTALRLRGVDEHVYSKEDFDFEMKTLLPYGLVVAMIVLPILLVNEQDAPTVDQNMTTKNLVWKPNELYRERLNGVIDDFVEWGLL